MILSIYASLCAYFDLKTGKIPNKLHILFIIYLIATFQIKLIMYIFIITLLLMPIYYFKLFGAGDIKMFALIIAKVGYISATKIFLAASLFCILVTLIKMLLKRELLPHLLHLYQVLIYRIYSENNIIKLNMYPVRFGFYFGVVTVMWSIYEKNIINF